ncbi:hypothetical protein FMM56_03005 [Campylobacter sp. LR264d]|uniref:hypothetical protein n=1 Tax=Campylobacter sp. LR264d TaxID=2593544 RepID=UPI00123BF231|nr:hypothetical protein [Campylobacter sp. LR264d]KAA6233603.1 hypothetical protein FMM56_03005 [Campylobacter sp. LR264d]
MKQKYFEDKPKQIEVSTDEALKKTKEDLEFAKLISFKYQKTQNKYFFISKICTHIILDMDKVIINSITLMARAWSESSGEKYASFDEYKKYIGISFNQICSKIGVI